MDAQLLAAKYNDYLINPVLRTQRLSAETIREQYPEAYNAQKKRVEMRERGIFVSSDDSELEHTYFEKIDAQVRPYVCKCVESVKLRKLQGALQEDQLRRLKLK
ncbi:hypothetical protein OSTOST_18983 [Ostertagia ostertagi]